MMYSTDTVKHFIHITTLQFLSFTGCDRFNGGLCFSLLYISFGSGIGVIGGFCVPTWLSSTFVMNDLHKGRIQQER